ncbi:MAG: Eco57I restriction-modification methylase domain-containing protein [Bradymonadia bacterium]
MIKGQKREKSSLSGQELLRLTESRRVTANEKLDPESKTVLGQYMTPSTVASYMASLFPAPKSKEIKLLDPGAGVGSLSSAFVNHMSSLKSSYCIEATAFEIEEIMLPYLRENFLHCESMAQENGSSFTWKLQTCDFITETTNVLRAKKTLWKNEVEKYTHCIMNPPYKKIHKSSLHRRALSLVGIETVNLYSAFVALAILLLEDAGYLVAIIPRSFCNGPYFRPFRELLLKNTAIRRIHLFASRTSVFKEDKVLQENVIIALEKNVKQSDVLVSISEDDSFSKIAVNSYKFDNIVKNDDESLVIHIPTQCNYSQSYLKEFRHSLSDIQIQISTGPVVDFRLKEHLRKMPETGTVPLLYPSHFKNGALHWPQLEGKKANAILANADTKKWLYPSGYYCVVRRFSSKEEKRRIYPSVIEPSVFAQSEFLGIENHLNVFHQEKKPLSEELARGLAVYLGSSIVDAKFRRFSGHTQVNATDLKMLKYPSRKELIELGRWAMTKALITQEMIDARLESILR